MLPGLRFLFVAIVLSVSTLVFGLGAAALLRATHEEFASLPSKYEPETIFAQQDNADSTLAMLRIDIPDADHESRDHTASSDAPAAAAASTETQSVATLTNPDFEKTEASTDTPQIEENAESKTTALEPAAPKAPDQVEAVVTALVSNPDAETKNMAIASADTATPVADNATSKVTIGSSPVSMNTNIAATKIATLGGPPVVIEPSKSSKILPGGVKAIQARRVVKQRKIAQRAQIARPAPQKPVNPFAPPAPAPSGG
jgi:hypothetical protein